MLACRWPSTRQSAGVEIDCPAEPNDVPAVSLKPTLSCNFFDSLITFILFDTGLHTGNLIIMLILSEDQLGALEIYFDQYKQSKKKERKIMIDGIASEMGDGVPDITPMNLLKVRKVGHS